MLANPCACSKAHNHSLAQSQDCARRLRDESAGQQIATRWSAPERSSAIAGLDGESDRNAQPTLQGGLGPEHRRCGRACRYFSHRHSTAGARVPSCLTVMGRTTTRRSLASRFFNHPQRQHWLINAAGHGNADFLRRHTVPAAQLVLHQGVIQAHQLQIVLREARIQQVT